MTGGASNNFMSPKHTLKYTSPKLVQITLRKRQAGKVRERETDKNTKRELKINELTINILDRKLRRE